MLVRCLARTVLALPLALALGCGGSEPTSTPKLPEGVSDKGPPQIPLAPVPGAAAPKDGPAPVAPTAQ